MSVGSITDPSIFSILIPTWEGTRFLKRVLDYFQHIGFEGAIVLSDNSSGEHRDFVARCPREYPELDLEVHGYPPQIRFLDKMVASLERVDSRFVMLHAHDDFLLPDPAQRCVSFLEDHPDYSVARGRVAMMALSRIATGPEAGKTQLSLMPHPMRGYEQDDPAERVLGHIEHYASTFYSVHRRETLIESFRLTETATKNVIFFQYLSSCVCALRGRVRCLDELFYVRQGHEDSWSGMLKNSRDYEHWPMLVTSPDFSRYYQEFRGTLAKLVAETCGGSTEERAAAIDIAALGLFRRGFCGEERDNPQEAAFLQRLYAADSEERGLVNSVVQFALQYPDTL